MSHVVTLEMDNITDLDALKAACNELGLEFRENQKTYRWWGHSVGDYPIPAGFTAEELGHCEHALRVKDDPEAYEVGVVKAKNGRPGFSLIYDFYGSRGRAVQRRVGEKGEKLNQRYVASYAVKHWQRKGYRVTTTTRQDGHIVVRATR